MLKCISETNLYEYTAAVPQARIEIPVDVAVMRAGINVVEQQVISAFQAD